MPIEGPSKMCKQMRGEKRKIIIWYNPLEQTNVTCIIRRKALQKNLSSKKKRKKTIGSAI